MKRSEANFIILMTVYPVPLAMMIMILTIMIYLNNNTNNDRLKAQGSCWVQEHGHQGVEQWSFGHVSYSWYCGARASDGPIHLLSRFVSGPS